jgi:MFS superfamily sulfate permease-like transporter
MDFKTLRELWKVSRIEFLFALISIAGAVGFGVLKGVIVAVCATLLYILMKGMQPRDAQLGRIPGREGFYKLHRYEQAKPVPGTVIYLLQGSLLFFNVEHVRSSIENIFATLAPDTRTFIFDAGAVSYIDSTAAVMLDDIRALSAERGIRFAIVELHSEPLEMLERAGVVAKVGQSMIFDDLEAAVKALASAPESPANVPV